jgi:hypothetical protein
MTKYFNLEKIYLEILMDVHVLSATENEKASLLICSSVCVYLYLYFFLINAWTIGRILLIFAILELFYHRSVPDEYEHSSSKQKTNLPLDFTLVSCLSYSSTLKMEATCYSEKSVDIQQTTRRYIPEDRILEKVVCWIQFWSIFFAL